MGIDDLGGLAEKGNFAHHLVAAFAMLFHDRHLFVGEFAALEKNAVGRGDLADVMQKCASRDDSQVIGLESNGLCQCDGIGGYSL